MSLHDRVISEALRYSQDRCTNRTLQALGVPTSKSCHAVFGSDVIHLLKKHGLRTIEIHFKGTLRQFAKVFPKGRFYISSPGHAMALVDGNLTDTAERGIDGRHIGLASEVLKPGEKSRVDPKWYLHNPSGVEGARILMGQATYKGHKLLLYRKEYHVGRVKPDVLWIVHAQSEDIYKRSRKPNTVWIEPDGNVEVMHANPAERAKLGYDVLKWKVGRG